MGMTALAPVGILCAGEAELAPFLDVLEGRTTQERAMLSVHLGTIAGLPAAALYCGACKVNAALAAQMLIDVFGVAALINAGTAGAVSPDLRLLDTVVSTAVCHHDVAEAVLTAFHPRLPSVWMPADPRLLDAARLAARGRADVHFGPMATGERFVTERSRGRIAERFAPLSVDMESAAAAQVCRANGVPFLAVRTITDAAGCSAEEDFQRNCARASSRAAALTVDLLRQLPAEL